jgi:hypothetical protein
MFSSLLADRLPVAKLDIPNAGLGTSSGNAVKGLASFNTDQFSASGGFISFTGTIQASDLASIGAKTVLANNGASAAKPVAVSMDDVVISGRGIRKTEFTQTGIMTVASILGGAANTVTSSLQFGSINAGNTLVQRDNNGDFAARTVTLGGVSGAGLRLSDAGFGITPAETKTAFISERINASTGQHVLYSFSGHAAIRLSGGTIGSAEKTAYSATLHEFTNKTGGGATVTLGAGGSINVGAAGVLTTGAAATVGFVTGDWQLTAGSRLQATYADLAEYYSSDKEYAVGWVMMFGGSAEVTAANINGTTKVAGVVSTDPAYIMNSALEGTRVCLALQGRVPCRVVGKIKKGDLIIASDILGVAVSAGENARAGTIIGKALADYDSDHIGLIEVAVGRV